MSAIGSVFYIVSTARDFTVGTSSSFSETHIGFVLGEMYQVHAILSGIERSFLGTSFTIVDDNLVIVGGGY